MCHESLGAIMIISLCNNIERRVLVRDVETEKGTSTEKAAHYRRSVFPLDSFPIPMTPMRKTSMLDASTAIGRKRRRDSQTSSRTMVLRSRRKRDILILLSIKPRHAPVTPAMYLTPLTSSLHHVFSSPINCSTLLRHPVTRSRRSISSPLGRQAPSQGPRCVFHRQECSRHWSEYRSWFGICCQICPKGCF